MDKIWKDVDCSWIKIPEQSRNRYQRGYFLQIDTGNVTQPVGQEQWYINGY